MSRKFYSVLVLVLILSASAFFTASPAQAATITVTSKLDAADPGRCRLRDAIIAANTNTATGDCSAGAVGEDTIGFSLGIQCNLVPCTITLTSALPAVTESLTINGNNTVISGANAFRVFDLGAVPVSISDLSIINGNAPDFDGAINMSDIMATTGTNLTLTHVFFSNNHADFGGAIYQPRGTLTIVNSRFSGNGAGTHGGAILEERNGTTLLVADSIFSSNTAVGGGGAMDLAGLATITGSTFSGNIADFGGAIAKVVQGNLQLENSVFDHNAATVQTTSTGGGAIYLFQGAGTATMTNVTVSGNSTKNDGGGIYAITLPVNMNNVTITNNSADSDSDGIGNGGGFYADLNTVQVRNSIIAGNFDRTSNTSGETPTPDCSGVFTSLGYNLIGISDTCLGFANGVNADKVGKEANPINPLLAPLANFGGLTQTHALLLGSPAINAGNPLPPGSGGLACAGTDQRGVLRPHGSTCDIGAYETEMQNYLPLVLR
jgi:predicted outer membrane repeat protein